MIRRKFNKNDYFDTEFENEFENVTPFIKIKEKKKQPKKINETDITNNKKTNED